MKAPTNKSEAKTVLDDMRNASWSSFNVTGIPGPVLVNETRNQQNNVLEDGRLLIMYALGIIYFNCCLSISYHLMRFNIGYCQTS